jgi:hypothetical protein
MRPKASLDAREKEPWFFGCPVSSLVAILTELTQQSILKNSISFSMKRGFKI